MSDLVGFDNESSKTMSSLEISELTGKRHYDVVQDIERIFLEVEIDKTDFSVMQKGANNKMLLVYHLPKRECNLVISAYSSIYRLAIIDRWEQLEEKSKFEIPKTYSEALRLASQQAEKIEEQQFLISEQAPKVAFFDQVTGSNDCFDMADVSKVCNLGVGRNTLFLFLRESKILRENNTPYQQYIDNGYFRVIESKYSKPDGSINISLKTVVYQKGIDFIIKRFVGRNLTSK